MLRMKIRRRGDDDGIHFFGGSNFVKGIRAEEELLGVDGAIAFGLLQLVEVSAGGIELVLKQVCERDDTRAAGVDQIRGVFGAAPAATEQPHADRRASSCA